MKEGLWIYIIIAIITAFIGSIFAVSLVLVRHQKRNDELGIARSKKISSNTTVHGRKWNWLISIYLFSCFIITVIILYQSGWETNRAAVDCLAVPVGAVFFLIGAFSRRNKGIRRERATVLVTASYVMSQLCSSSDSGRSYRSIFEFSVKDKTYRVHCSGKPYKKEEGAQIELYYAPDDPSVVYVPELEKRKGMGLPSAILLIYGCLFPAAALLSPLFR